MIAREIKHPVLIAIYLLFFTQTAIPGNGPYLDAALQTARWLRSAAIPAPQGKVWAADPNDKNTTATNLYSGSAGVVLFFLEAYYSTGDTSCLNDARAGADYLLMAISNENELASMDYGLYTGIAGLGFVLGETFGATHDNKYREGLQRCAELIRTHATRSGNGVAWVSHQVDTTFFVTDIIGGSAGIGLFLLYASSVLNESRYRDLAVKAGERLIAAGQMAGGGKKWAMDAKEPELTPIFRRLMPNFSHGTAGIAYFLTMLYKETKENKYLEAAKEGASYLQSVALSDSGTACVFHDEPDNKNLFYLGWCHGPPGTARLFYQLYKITGDTIWMNWVEKFARADLQSGIPEKQVSGFWNNVSQCCGSAGVAEFFLDLYRVTGNQNYLEFSKQLTSNLLKRGTNDKQGTRWIQAEHRVRPDLLVAQTGYMQGAAGIGMWLLHLDAFEHGRKGKIVFPDSPF